MKTSELTGAALDWATGIAEQPDGAKILWKLMKSGRWKPSTDWEQGGPIIERERLGVCYYHEVDGWETPNWASWRTDIDDRVQIMGETALVAAMRCFCSAKLGDEIDIPEELCQQRSS